VKSAFIQSLFPVSFSPSADICCLLRLKDTYPTAKVTEEVNRKFPARNTTVQLSTAKTDPQARAPLYTTQQTDRQTDGQTEDSMMPNC